MIKRVLSWDYSDYVPRYKSLVRNHSEKEIRAEYTKLRDIASKRLKRLAASEFNDSQLYKRYSKGFPKLRNITSNSQLAFALSDVSSFLNAKTSSVSGMKEARNKAVQSLREHGYDFINKSNIKAFGEFMEDVKAMKQDRIYDSKRIANMFNMTRHVGIKNKDIQDNFGIFMKHQKKLENLSKKIEKKLISKDAVADADLLLKYLNGEAKINKKTGEIYVPNKRNRNIISGQLPIRDNKDD